ncbi:hypothetical protein [Streptomyces sp. 6N223]|uniref:hypothetical protein n=1 Tax=Streptomyces sp. 6N223 TaxID=3457412 RepID=UPI003FD2067E
MLTTSGGWRLTSRIARLGLLWCCGLAAIVYVPALWMIGLLGRCAAEREDSLLCTDAGGWTLMLLPIVLLPGALVVGTRAALRDSGKGWAAWAACLAAVAAVGGGYAYIGLAW